jgi:hypothetical protein
MDAVNPSWLDAQWPPPSSPEGVIRMLLPGPGGFDGKGNGTFVFDQNDEVQDWNSGSIPSSVPFTAEAIANGVTCDYDQHFESGADIIGICLIEYRLQNNDNWIRKSQPHSQD